LGGIENHPVACLDPRSADKREKGGFKKFEWAKNEIISSLTLERRQKETEKLLEQLA